MADKYPYPFWCPQNGRHPLAIRIHGDLYLSADKKDALRAILSSADDASVMKFIKAVDLALWAFSRECALPNNYLHRQLIKQRDDERRQLESLNRAAMTIAEVMSHPAGDLARRLEGWYPADRLLSDALQLLHATSHIADSTSIQRGHGKRADDRAVAPYVIIVRTFLSHFRWTYALSATEEGVLYKVANAILGKCARRMLARAVRQYEPHN